MRTTTIDDCYGVRWTIRARHERHAEPDNEHARHLRAPALEARLAPMLAPEPTPVPGAEPTAVGPGAPGKGMTRIGQDRYTKGLGRMRAAGRGGPLGSILAIWIGIRVLTEPTDRFWVVELCARGRLRRGATWKMAGREEAAAAAVVVADAVHAGRVPHLTGALLIDVVDERLTVYGAPR